MECRPVCPCAAKTARPESTLHQIVKDGLTPLFQYWLKEYPTNLPLAQRPADEWASSRVLMKYVQYCVPLTKPKIETFESVKWTEIVRLWTTLEKLTGVCYIRLGPSQWIIVDFVDQEKVTVMTIHGEAEIQCEDRVRSAWSRNLMNAVFDNDQQALRDVTVFKKNEHHVRSGCCQVAAGQIATIEIIH